MARGKYLSLEEARKMGKLDQFAKEHPSEGDGALFDLLMDRAAAGLRNSEAASGTSVAGSSEGSSETRTRRGS